jgi:hypothetical protein
VASTFVAVFDACVLYPAPVRDLIMRLSVTGLFRARWTDRIHEEWIGAVLRNRADLQREQLERTRELMDEAVPDCLVTDYEGIESTLVLPDPDDRHVLAAAIKCGAGTIVTYNLKDFPDAVLAPLGLCAQHPDEFLEHAYDLDPVAVCKAVRDARAALKNPPVGARDLLDIYQGLGLATTVAALRSHIDTL